MSNFNIIAETSFSFEINKNVKTRNLNYLILKLDMLESLLSQECNVWQTDMVLKKKLTNCLLIIRKYIHTVSANIKFISTMFRNW
jgi:DNA-binding winged helix-turn-helix (wHTH) protein